MAPTFKMATSLLVAAVGRPPLGHPTRSSRLGTGGRPGDAGRHMVPVQKPAEQVVVMIPAGGTAGTIMAGSSPSPICMQCRCCSRSNPGTCQTTKCCSSFKCDLGGRCTLVQEKCDCGGCGGAN